MGLGRYSDPEEWLPLSAVVRAPLLPPPPALPKSTDQDEPGVTSEVSPVETTQTSKTWQTMAGGAR